MMDIPRYCIGKKQSTKCAVCGRPFNKLCKLDREYEDGVEFRCGIAELFEEGDGAS